MLKSEIIGLLDVWSDGVKKSFYLKNPPYHNEVLVFEKDWNNDKLFNFIRDYSTADYRTLTQSELVALLQAGTLEHTYSFTSFPSDALRLKTKGCTCGEWANREGTQYTHSRWCEIYQQDYGMVKRKSVDDSF